MKVYVVTETTDEYSNVSTYVSAVFSTQELADEYAANMKALPDNRGDDFEVAEATVWDQPGERIVEYRIEASHGPGYLGRRRDKPYRVERYVPSAFQAELFSSSSLEFSEKDHGWFYISVSARTEAECVEEYLRLLRSALEQRLADFHASEEVKRKRANSGRSMDG